MCVYVCHISTRTFVLLMCKYNKKYEFANSGFDFDKLPFRFDLYRPQQIRQRQIYKSVVKNNRQRANVACLLVDIKFDLPIDKLPIFTAKIPLKAL